MTRSLLGRGPQGATDDPFALLTACHERIRRHSGLAVAIARAPGDTPPAQLAEAAAAVVRYFDKGLPLHVADEDESLTPLVAPSPALTLMREEHVEIEARLAELLPPLGAVAAAPAERGRLDPHLDALVALQALLERHLVNEEQNIFPTAQVALDVAGRRTLFEAMRARRAPT